MARIKNDNLYLEPFQKVSWRDDDGTEAASMYWDGDQMVFNGITISGAQGPAGPAGTGVPGNYIGDEDGNTRVTINTTDNIILRTAGTDRLTVAAGGSMLIGHTDITGVTGKFNIEHTSSNHIVLDRHTTDAYGAGMVFRKGRGGREYYSITDVANNDRLGEFSFYGYGSAGGTGSYLQGAAIRAITDGSITSASMPTRLEFLTTEDLWTNAVVGLTVTDTGGIKLSSGEEVNGINATVTNGNFNTLVTEQAVYDAVYNVEQKVEDVYTTFSGIDLKMNKIFDPTVSGTEVKIEEDGIGFYNEGGLVGQFDNAGYFKLQGSVGVTDFYNGSLRTEASALTVPTSAAVKAYVDEYGGSSGYAGNKLETTSGLSSLELGDTSWAGELNGRPILQLWEKTHMYGSMFGKKTRHVYFGDKINDLPTSFLYSNVPDEGYPTMLLHSLGGSKLYLYNKKSYGDDTLPFSNPPTIIFDQRETSEGDSMGKISFGGSSSLEFYHGNTESYPNLPSTENEAHLRLGEYFSYLGGIYPASTSRDDYAGGILKLFCKLRFGNGYVWGNENSSDLQYPYLTDEMSAWGHYGNNVWVNRIAGCHYTKTREEVGAKFDNPPEYFIGTGNDDHCLVTGKYVHTAIDVATAAWEEKISTSTINSSASESYNAVPNRVQCSSSAGTYLTYGYVEEWDRFLWLAKGKYGESSAYKSGAFFRSARGDTGNKVFIESVATGAPDPLADALSGYKSTASNLIFFRSRRGWYGDTAEYGAQPVKAGDIIGGISWIGQAALTGYNKNPCQNYSAYSDDAWIRVFADDNAGNYGVNSRMVFAVRGSGGGGIEDIRSSMSLESNGNIILGLTTPSKGKAGRYGILGKAHIISVGYAKQTLSGSLTLTQAQLSTNYTNPMSIMFSGGQSPSTVAALDVSNHTGAYFSTSTGGPVPFARIDGGPDSITTTQNGGRLSLLIHKHNSIVFDEVFRINSGGQIIVGTDGIGQSCGMSNPPSKLTIAQATDSVSGGLSLVNQGGSEAFIFNNVSGALTLSGGEDGDLGVNINPGDGVVHIGGDTDTGAEYILRTNGTIIPALNNIYDLGSSTYKWDDIWATNNVIQTSDARQKTEVRTADFGLDFVKQMKPRSFVRKGGVRRHYGFIAQELEALVKKFGRSTKDAAFIVKDDEGNYGLRDTQLLAIIIKAIQELADKVEG